MTDAVIGYHTAAPLRRNLIGFSVVQFSVLFLPQLYK